MTTAKTEQTKAQKLAYFLNFELAMKPEQVNAVLEVLREQFPHVMWDSPAPPTKFRS